MSDDNAQPGRFAYDGLDRVIHEKARLGILTSLIANPNGLSFSDLRRLCDLTDGNLSRHLQVLEEEKMIDVSKRFERQKPLTTCKITRFGHKKYLDYLTELERVVKDAAGALGMSNQAKPRLRPL